jgi:hypothetical protein
MLAKDHVRVCKSIEIKCTLFSGGFAGAIISGGPIPWDDDIDAAVFIENKKKFNDAFNSFELPSFGGKGKVKCHEHWNALKLFVTFDDGIDYRFTGVDYGFDKRDFRAPYIDVIMIKEDESSIFEVNPKGIHHPAQVKFAKGDFLSLREYYYGGLRLLGPSMSAFFNDTRYKVKGMQQQKETIECYAPFYNHRLERYFVDPKKVDLSLDCCSLQRAGLPFVNQKKSEDGQLIEEELWGGEVRLDSVIFRVKLNKVTSPVWLILSTTRCILQ